MMSMFGPNGQQVLVLIAVSLGCPPIRWTR